MSLNEFECVHVTTLESGGVVGSTWELDNQVLTVFHKDPDSHRASYVAYEDGKDLDPEDISESDAINSGYVSAIQFIIPEYWSEIREVLNNQS